MPAPKLNQFAVGTDGGRPSLLTDDFIEQIIVESQKYIGWCEKNPIVIEKTKTVTEDSGKEVVTVERETRVRLPTLAGLAVRIGCPKSTLLTWTKTNEVFSRRLESFIDTTENIKWEHGAAGTMNAHIAKFGLSALHDYKEKNETDVTSGGKPIAILGGNTQDALPTDQSG